MKDKRNCGVGYPIYQSNMMPPMPIPFQYQQGNGIIGNNIERQLNDINQQINLLEQRVKVLESLNSSTASNNYLKYNDSNYYMV